MQQLTEIQQINRAIMFGNFTNDELTSILDAVKWSRAQLAKTNARTFRVGSTVKFTDRKRGITHSGTVEKVKLKYALVTTQRGRYNVPLNLLESA